MDVGVIGVGMMGRNHARVYAELRAVDRLLVQDLDRKAADEMARMHGATVCDTPEQLLREADAVSICVPTPHHLPVAKLAAGSGVHMLIEKPICATAAQGRELLGILPQDLTVGIGHIERFNPIVPEIRKIAKQPLYVEMKRHNPASSRVSGSSVVEDLMIHDIDIVLHAFFVGQQCMLHSTGTDDVAAVLMRCGSTDVYLSASRKASKKIRICYVEEEEFTIEGDFMSQEIFVYRKPGQYSVENERYVQENIIEKVMVNKVEPLKVELKTFLDCAAAGKPFPITPAQAVRNLEVCEEISRGLRR
jgi:predicted dehydrogenase